MHGQPYSCAAGGRVLRPVQVYVYDDVFVGTIHRVVRLGLLHHDVAQHPQEYVQMLAVDEEEAQVDLRQDPPGGKMEAEQRAGEH